MPCGERADLLSTLAYSRSLDLTLWGTVIGSNRGAPGQTSVRPLHLHCELGLHRSAPVRLYPAFIRFGERSTHFNRCE
jgi:hypothetical protein